MIGFFFFFSGSVLLCLQAKICEECFLKASRDVTWLGPWSWGWALTVKRNISRYWQNTHGPFQRGESGALRCVTPSPRPLTPPLNCASCDAVFHRALLDLRQRGDRHKARPESNKQSKDGRDKARSQSDNGGVPLMTGVFPPPPM